MALRPLDPGGSELFGNSNPDAREIYGG